jgi:hypothetical protein
MTALHWSRLIVLGVAANSLTIAGRASAQGLEPINPTPPQRLLDSNNVDLASSSVALSKVMIKGGDPARPLAAIINIGSGGAMLNFEPSSTSYFSNPGYLQSFGSPIGNFVWRVSTPNPIIWTMGPSGGGLTSNYFFNRAGDKFIWQPTGSDPMGIVYADGETWRYYYGVIDGGNFLKFVVSNRGYGIQISYNTSSSSNWVKGFTYYNKAFVYCDESQGVDCAAVSALPTAGTISTITSGLGNPTYSGGTDYNGADIPIAYDWKGAANYAAPGEQGINVFYAGGGDSVHSFTDVIKVEKAGIASSARTYTYIHGSGGGDDMVARSGLIRASDGTSIWNYSVMYDAYYGGPLTENGHTATDPNNKTYSATAISWLGTPGTITDQLNRTWRVGYDGNARITWIENPELDWTGYTYDSRGNPIEEKRVAKSGSGLADLVRTAGYDTTCSNILTCNKPNWVKDFKGNQTDITYDPNNGGVATLTGPADANGVRPQKRLTYVQRYAWILNSTGSYVHASTPVWLLASEKTCRTTATVSGACAGGASDEVTTVYEYGPDTGLVGNNLFLRGVAVTADAGGTMVTLRTCYAYDQQGNKISETKPFGTASLTVCP